LDETSADAGPTLRAPNFDAGSVRRARPAVPLTRADGRPSTLTWALVALAAGMLGGLLGIFALNSYQRGAAETAPAVAEASEGAKATQAGAADGGASPVPGDGAQTSGAQMRGQAIAESVAAARPVGAAAETADGAAAAEGPAPTGDAAELRGALAGWVAATNARDLERQMDFYDARVGVFYLSRNASRAAVRAEKSNVFSRATAVDVRAEEPQISLSPDGQTATMRFRKRYAIEGEGMERRGAVLQELRWRRTPAGWKIIGERDLRVIE
jgi:ketosteroid isomerase-like protein